MKKIPLHARILGGMLLGVAAGIICQEAGVDPVFIQKISAWIKPLGDIFLRMIFMMVVPLILSALTLGVADLGDLKRIGRIGLKALVYTIFITGISVIIGITTVQIFRPGDSVTLEQRELLLSQYEHKYEKIAATAAEVKDRNPLEVLVNIIPRNPMEDMVRAFDPTYTGGGLLSVMFLSLVLGIALSASDPQKTSSFRGFLEGLYEIVMKVIGYAMQFAPIGVASLMFVLTANMGYGILLTLLNYVLVVLLALAIHQFGTYSLVVYFLGGMKPAFFFGKIREVMLTAFATSSSNATLPDAIRVSIQKLKLPKEITHFVLTVGSTANQNGTALYEGITVLFLAQVFGVDLSLSQQVIVVFMSVLAGIGTAGVPGGSLPLIVMVLMSVGIPGESIALIYGVDRILDMSRTVLNVTGDITAAVVISRSEKEHSIALPE
jgi:dicarboxylate/amino acid:cation (Na+ or H+) symporter, DAACS family